MNLLSLFANTRHEDNITCLLICSPDILISPGEFALDLRTSHTHQSYGMIQDLLLNWASQSLYIFLFLNQGFFHCSVLKLELLLPPHPHIPHFKMCPLFSIAKGSGFTLMHTIGKDKVQMFLSSLFSKYCINVFYEPGAVVGIVHIANKTLVLYPVLEGQVFLYEK